MTDRNSEQHLGDSCPFCGHGSGGHYAECDISVFDRQITKLEHAIEILWSEIDAKTLSVLERDAPEVVELAQGVHHRLWHATTHEERMVSQTAKSPSDEGPVVDA